MKKIKSTFVTLIAISSFTLIGCGYMARSLATPNQCKKCEVIGPGGNVAWSENECGGGVYNMEDRAKVAAYDMGCDYSVRCETYKAEEE